MLINWKEEYSVNITEIDDQHKMLISMVNEMHEAMKKGESKEILGPILDRLVQYTKEHFAREESIMEENGYPEFKEHKEKHNKMTQKVLSLQHDYHNDKFHLSFEVSKFLQEWLNKHILGTDKKYTAYLNTQGVK